MKKKKIGVIVLAVAFIGAVTGGVSYKASLQKDDQKSLETTAKSDVKSNVGQTEGENKIEIPSENKEFDKKVEDVKTTHSDEQTEVNESKDVSDFELKLKSYVKEFRDGECDVPDFMRNLDSIDTKDLNSQEKTQLDDAKKAIGDWSDLNSFYSQIRMAGSGSMEDIVWHSGDSELEYAKEILKNTNTKNIVDAGVASKEKVDQEISFLKEYIEKKQEQVDKQKEDERQAKIDSQKADQEYKKLDEQHAKLKTTEEKKEFYYEQISKAMKAQVEYIDSLKTDKEKQSVQSSIGAANGEAVFLEMRYPKDSKIIEESLSEVLNPNK